MTRIILHFALLAMVALSGVAHAQGFATSDTTCYSWNGGNFSAGSFSKCHTDNWPVAVAQAKLPPPVQPSPIMMPQSAPVSCVPPPRHIVKRKPKPKAVECK
jgi:hypothetical protein